MQVQAEQSTEQSATISLKGSGNGFVTVRDRDGAVTEVIDQRQLRLNQPSPDAAERIRASRKARLERSKEAVMRREEERKSHEEAEVQQAKQKEADAAEAAKVRQAAAFKKYEEDLALPMRERRTGRYRPEPVQPEGYTPDWSNSDS
ncbi:MAG: hypothetical protein IID08_07415 [Candidatus Hydrogenedentes bacterium]|nr:hypothetical protein [Candidatus Hydrogenedentota bacterium]